VTPPSAAPRPSGLGITCATPYRFIALDEGHWQPELRPPVVADAIVDRVTSPRPEG
jgi:hypothetical protein